jgi:type I restriction enzyme M protein
MQADGYSLNDPRQQTEQNDIPDIIKLFSSLKAESKRARTDKSFLVPVKEL